MVLLSQNFFMVVVEEEAILASLTATKSLDMPLLLLRTVSVKSRKNKTVSHDSLIEVN